MNATTTTTTAKAITIVGRRWFNRLKGHSYYAVDIYVDGVQVPGIAYASGYGSEYAWAAMGQLVALGVVTDRKGSESLHSWAGRNGVALTDTVVDVPRKKDL